MPLQASNLWHVILILRRTKPPRGQGFSPIVVRGIHSDHRAQCASRGGWGRFPVSLGIPIDDTCSTVSPWRSFQGVGNMCLRSPPLWATQDLLICQCFPSTPTEIGGLFSLLNARVNLGSGIGIPLHVWIFFPKFPSFFPEILGWGYQPLFYLWFWML